MKGGFKRTPPFDFFGLKYERLDQIPKALAQLFLDNEYMFWQLLNDVTIDDVSQKVTKFRFL